MKKFATLDKNIILYNYYSKLNITDLVTRIENFRNSSLITFDFSFIATKPNFLMKELDKEKLFKALVKNYDKKLRICTNNEYIKILVRKWSPYSCIEVIESIDKYFTSMNEFLINVPIFIYAVNFTPDEVSNFKDKTEII